MFRFTEQSTANCFPHGKIKILQVPFFLPLLTWLVHRLVIVFVGKRSTVHGERERALESGRDLGGGAFENAQDARRAFAVCRLERCEPASPFCDRPVVKIVNACCLM